MSWDTYLRSLFALVFVMLLITATGWAIRRFGPGTLRAGPRRKRRLSLAEVLPLDGRRRLVLVQRDGVEHLLVIGGNADLVVERGIAAGSPVFPDESGAR